MLGPIVCQAGRTEGRRNLLVTAQIAEKVAPCVVHEADLPVVVLLPGPQSDGGHVPFGMEVLHPKPLQRVVEPRQGQFAILVKSDRAAGELDGGVVIVRTRMHGAQPGCVGLFVPIEFPQLSSTSLLEAHTDRAGGVRVRVQRLEFRQPDLEIEPSGRIPDCPRYRMRKQIVPRWIEFTKLRLGPLFPLLVLLAPEHHVGPEDEDWIIGSYRGLGPRLGERTKRGQGGPLDEVTPQRVAEALEEARLLADGPPDFGRQIRVHRLDPQSQEDRPTLEAMKAAGFIAIMCSPDTASPTTVDAWGKDFDVAELASMAQTAGEMQLPVMWSFMFGGPKETPATVSETLAFIRESIHEDHPVMLTSRMRIYPGTTLARVAVDEGYAAPGLDPMEGRQFYASQDVESEWLDEQLLDLQRALPNVMFMDGSQSRAIPWISRMRALFGVSGPSWTGYARTRRRLKRFGLG